MKRTMLYQALTVLALLGAGLPGCETLEKCPPSPTDAPCSEIPACSRNRVWVFLIAGFDPLDGMGVLREGLIEHKFIKVYCAPRPYGYYYVKEIQRLHAADPEARFVIVAHGGASMTARSVADHAGTPIDLMVFIDNTGTGPAHAERVVLVCNDKACPDDDKVAQLTVRIADAGHDTAKHPQAAEIIAGLLDNVAAKIPIVEQGPACELAGCPSCGPGWDFLRPDGHDSGCVNCKPMNLAGTALPATIEQPVGTPDRLPLPRPENKDANAAPANSNANANPAPKQPAAQPTPANKVMNKIRNRVVPLPPPPTRPVPLP